MAYFGQYRIVQGATRSDGYAFLLTNLKEEGVMVKAGCHNMSIAKARAHWTKTRAGTALGEETFAILDNLEALARIRGLSMEPVT